MQVRILSTFLLVSSSLFCAVVCDPNHHHNHNNESTIGILETETTEGVDMPVVAQNGTTILSDNVNDALSLGLKIGVPIVSIILIILFWYCVCKCCYVCVDVCCCGCDEEEKPGVVVMQNIHQQPATAMPQIILQQPIVYQHSGEQPPPQGPPQWNQPPQGPPQWNPHPMGQHQQYSPQSGYDNAGFDNVRSPPHYDTRKY